MSLVVTPFIPNVGVLFLVLPFALGISDPCAAYYLLSGVAVIVVIGLSAPDEGMVSIWGFRP
ncbi:hypothetical protein [Defluviimonas sp. SAOS-178_SWC]|uniref:hypothetical protein n=1 Tax=Defluviimonas sp. SAOS-178_SWC TaxID=3121287 RepID=UPI003221EE15